MPQRWSGTHFYQAVLNGEEHVKDVKFLTTLAGYVHWKLTGKKVLGINDASGMFPVRDNDYDESMIDGFNDLLRGKGLDVSFKDLLPKVLVAGENAGTLTAEGAAWLDESGNLGSGIDRKSVV